MIRMEKRLSEKRTPTRSTSKPPSSGRKTFGAE